MCVIFALVFGICWALCSTGLTFKLKVLRLMVYTIVTNQEVFVKNSGGVVVVGSKAINYLHLYRMAVGKSGADND